MDKFTQVPLKETTLKMAKTADDTKSSPLVDRVKSRLYDEVLKFLTP